MTNIHKIITFDDLAEHREKVVMSEYDKVISPLVPAINSHLKIKVEAGCYTQVDLVPLISGDLDVKGATILNSQLRRAGYRTSFETGVTAAGDRYCQHLYVRLPGWRDV